MEEVSSKANSKHLSEEERSPSIASITSKDSSNIVKYLHPGDPASDMESTSEAPTDQSIAGSPSGQVGSSIATGKTGADDKSTPTASGPDSDIGSVDDLPIDDEDDKEENQDNVASKVTAGANYIGSFFTSAWSKTAKTTNDATTGGSGFLSSALNIVGGGSSKTSPKEESKTLPGEKEAEKPVEPEVNKTDPVTTTTTTNSTEPQVASIVNSSSSFFSSAWNKMGDFTKNVSGTSNTKTEPEQPETITAEQTETNQNQNDKSGGSFFTNFSTIVSKVASDATHVIKDKVGTSTSVATTMITEFNREQEEFIKSKGHEHENGGMAPWIGYQDEVAMKEKILSLSEDKRTFVRAPPSGVTFDFDYNSVAPVALAILQEDPKLSEMRYELVPKVVKEDEFWRNYFYRLNLIKQTFDLKDLESSNGDAGKKVPESKQVERTSGQIPDEEDQPNTSGDHDDEFVSDAFQASSKDLDEVNENMKRLGVKNTDDEWEAELEGELNEFEVVSSKEGSPHNQDWENEIETMLDAEETNK